MFSRFLVVELSQDAIKATTHSPCPSFYNSSPSIQSFSRRMLGTICGYDPTKAYSSMTGIMSSTRMARSSGLLRRWNRLVSLNRMRFAFHRHMLITTTPISTRTSSAFCTMKNGPSHLSDLATKTPTNRVGTFCRPIYGIMSYGPNRQTRPYQAFHHHPPPQPPGRRVRRARRHHVRLRLCFRSSAQGPLRHRHPRTHAEASPHPPRAALAGRVGQTRAPGPHL